MFYNTWKFNMKFLKSPVVLWCDSHSLQPSKYLVFVPRSCLVTQAFGNGFHVRQLASCFLQLTWTTLKKLNGTWLLEMIKIKRAWQLEDKCCMKVVMKCGCRWYELFFDDRQWMLRFLFNWLFYALSNIDILSLIETINPRHHQPFFASYLQSALYR